MLNNVKNFVINCSKCNTIKTFRHLRPPPATLPPPARRFTTCHVDLVGPLPTTSTGKRYLMTMTDRFSRWLEAIPLSTINADTITETFIQHWISRFGIPSDIVSDRGLQFTSHRFSSTMEALGIKMNYTTAYHPKSNGLCERQHRRLKEALTAKSGDWEQALPWVLLGLRNTPRDESDVSAAQQLYGLPLVLPGAFIDLNEASQDHFQRELQKIKNFKPPRPPPAQAPSPCTKIPMMKYCYLRIDAVKPPLTPKYVGPFPVLRQTRNTVVIQRSAEETDCVALDRVKPYLSPQPPPAPTAPRRGRPPRLPRPGGTL